MLVLILKFFPPLTYITKYLLQSLASSTTACTHCFLTSSPRKMATFFVVSGTPAPCRALGSACMGRSVPGSGFNVPITSNNVSPRLRLVFGKPQYVFQMNTANNQVKTGKYNEAGR